MKMLFQATDRDSSLVRWNPQGHRSWVDQEIYKVVPPLKRAKRMV